MPARVRGYHYVRDPKTGRKRRVYSGASRARSSRRRGSAGSIFGTVYGRGAYYGRRARQPTIQRGMGPRGGRSRKAGGFLTLGFGGTDPPKMSMGKGGMVVSHREYIQDITSSVPFIGENFPLNPGIQTTFPWLSQIADNFEEWIPEAIIFEYKTTSSNTVVNTTNSNPGLGSVILATQYNSLNNDFGNKQQMENYENAVSVDPSRSVVHAIECAKGQTPVQPMYVRTGALPVQAGVSNDLRFYDHGKMTIATVGQQTNNFVIGELWVSYRIRFLKPRLQTGQINNENGVFAHFELFSNPPGTGPRASGLKPTTPFGTQTSLLAPVAGSTMNAVLSGGSTVVANQNNIQFPDSLGGTAPFPIFDFAGGQVQGTQVNSAANTFYFPPGVSGGRYLCTYVATYGTVSNTSPQIVTAGILTSGCVLSNFFNDGNATARANTGSASGTDIVEFVIEVQRNYARFTMAAVTDGTFANLSSADFTITSIPPGFGN